MKGGFPEAGYHFGFDYEFCKRIIKLDEPAWNKELKDLLNIMYELIRGDISFKQLKLLNDTFNIVEFSGKSIAGLGYYSFKDVPHDALNELCEIISDSLFRDKLRRAHD